MHPPGTGRTQISNPSSRPKGIASPSPSSPSTTSSTESSISPSKTDRKKSSGNSQSIGLSHSSGIPPSGNISQEIISGISSVTTNSATSSAPSDTGPSTSVAGNSTVSGRLTSHALPPTPQLKIAGSTSSAAGRASTKSGSKAAISGAASQASGAMAAKPSRPGATLGTRFGARGVIMRWEAISSVLEGLFFIFLKSLRLRSS